MDEIKQNDIIDNLRDVDGNATLLDILLEFENMLEEQGMYAYENWKLGEVVQGPKLSRYWLNVTLLYPYLKMPNPKAALRLQNIGCDVKFKKATLKVPRIVKTQDDLESNKKPKVDSNDVWLVDVWMPRKFVDEALTGRDVMDGDINQHELTKAYETGLDDETKIGQDT
jgi:hypothetical protein|tara:strand:+ start:597 stop:1103 length:507 start_codon:yes stop_codon:yes gene_type:complete